jgi:hypothetical protein
MGAHRPSGPMKRTTASLAVLALLAVLSVTQLAPLSLRPVDGVRDAGDPLLNSWILSWVNHQIFRRPLDLFQAPIFHPYPNALAFSEHLLPPALVAAPVEFLTGNSVLAHNFALFVAFVLSGFGTFLLVRALTGNGGAALLSAIIFAFSSYKIMHISHLQLLWSVGIPFFFLYLHRFLDGERARDAWLFALFLVIQALSCVYYGLFSIAVLALVLPVLLFLRRRRVSFALAAKLAVPLVLAVGVLALFSLPYASVFASMGLKRSLALGAEIQNYLAAFPTNRLWGKLLSGLGSPEKYLFPGLLAVGLSAFAMAGPRRGARAAGPAGRPAGGRGRRVLSILLAAAAGINILSLAVSLLGGARASLGPLSFSAKSPVKPLLFLFLIGLLALALRVIRYVRSPDRPERSAPVLAYAVLTAWAMWLSFGAGFAFLGKATMIVPMPFAFFYRNVLGFNGVREPVRFAVFVLFGVAVLAGFGAARLFAAMKRRGARAAVCAAFCIFLNVEYLAWPIDGITVPVGRDVPPVYRWLAKQPADSVVLELPFHEWIPDESVYLYFATIHRKTLVNGYSGFIPASTFLARDVFREFPEGESLDFLETFGVSHVVVHARMLPGGRDGEAFRRIEACADSRLKAVERFSYSFRRPNALSNEFGEDLVLSFTPESPSHRPAPAAPERVARIPPDGWTVTTGPHGTDTKALTDGDLDTVWSAGETKRPGQFIEIDLGRFRRLARVVLCAGSAAQDFGLDYRIETSEDGASWSPAEARYSRTEFLRALLRSQAEAGQTLHLEGVRARRIRIVQTGTSDEFLWSVAELRLYQMFDE